MKRIALLFAALLLASPTAAPAATGDWTEIMPGARMRVLSAGVEMGGRALVGLDIELGPGIVTYWRVPGETGLPTTLTVTGPDGAHGAEILWPLPEWELASGYVDMVYRGHVILPALVDASAQTPLTFDVMMGVCSDICVPFSASFALPGDLKADPGQSLRLRQAVNETPIAWQGTDPPVALAAFDRESGDLVLNIDPLRTDPLRVFPSLEGATEVFSAPHVGPDGKTLEFSLLARKHATEWQTAPLRLTFATDDGPYEIVHIPETR